MALSKHFILDSKPSKQGIKGKKLEQKGCLNIEYDVQYESHVQVARYDVTQ